MGTISQVYVKPRLPVTDDVLNNKFTNFSTIRGSGTGTRPCPFADPIQETSII